MEFKVGDRVKCIGYQVFNELGKVGTIIYKGIDEDWLIEFDENVGGHNGGGRGKHGHCVWEDECNLELVKDKLSSVDYCGIVETFKDLPKTGQREGDAYISKKLLYIWSGNEWIIQNNKCPTQCERIREYLKTHDEITQLEALTELGIMRLASRISEMKKRGEPIVSDTKTVENRWGEKCRVARYFYQK